ncbi:MAG: tetratricopeptide repeat protein, partial [Rhodospirillaceae bacterium]
NAAFSDLSMAVNLDRDSAIAWANRGLAQEMLNNPKDARRSYTRAITLDNSNKIAREGLGRVGNG